MVKQFFLWPKTFISLGGWPLRIKLVQFFF